MANQFERPDADVTNGSGPGNFQGNDASTTNLFARIDEVIADDSDFIRSPTSPVSEVYVCRLSDALDPLTGANHVMRMRTSADQDGQEAIDFTQQLRQNYTNEGSPGTLIASQSRTGVTSTAWVTSTYTLSGAEADAITDYTALFYRFIVNRP